MSITNTSQRGEYFSGIVIFSTALKDNNECVYFAGKNVFMKFFDELYWSNRWKTGETGWDVGYASPPIDNYMQQLTNKSLKILIPGAGNAYEGIVLHKRGFKNTYILDISEEPLKKIKKEHPGIPESCLILDDFFELNGQYDLIIEQTFFCAINPGLRRKYFEKCCQLLVPGGKLAGVLFNTEFNHNHPPFGGKAEEYLVFFEDLFEIKTYETCYNSIKPRENREWFMILVKK
jgi:SAM-dependent methyltransferase